MSDDALARAERTWASRFGERTGVRRWWVPGRIEVLGKHVDYAGGRSLLAAVDRGFHVLARPRRDSRVHLIDARSQQALLGEIAADLPPQPGRWSDYPVSVLRRLARDFPGAGIGMDAVLCSSLPSASGLSSSSAMVIATFLPLAAFNRLEQRDAWHTALPQPVDLAGYLGAVENGRAFGPFAADFGVGTQGGSEDHTAILCCRAGMVSCYRFLPVRLESETVLPVDWTFVVASSGVPAPKAGSARESYNRLSEETTALLTAWNSAHGTTHVSLLDILTADADAAERMTRLLGDHPNAERLMLRLGQFREECLEIIPGVVTALAGRRSGAISQLVDRSRHLAVTVLQNQIPETNALVRLARERGAIAASPFGAGFGGSVWALLPRSDAEGFREAWLADYCAAFPQHEADAVAFLSAPAAGARETT